MTSRIPINEITDIFNKYLDTQSATSFVHVFFQQVYFNLAFRPLIHTFLSLAWVIT